MRDFRDHRLDILVSTAVVEVGVDIPNATVMMVEGRSASGWRSSTSSAAASVAATPRAIAFSSPTAPRPMPANGCRFVEQTRDGFALAEADLRLRGPGEFFGTRQSGLPDLKVARLSDVPLIELARNEASRLLDEDADLTWPEHARLKEEVSRLWERVTSEAH